MSYSRSDERRSRPSEGTPSGGSPSGGPPSGGSGSPDPHSAPQVPSWRPPSWEDFRRMAPAPGNGHGWGPPPWSRGPMYGGRHDEHYRRAFEDWWENSSLKRRSGHGSNIPGWAHDVFRSRFYGRGGDRDRFGKDSWYSWLGREWVNGRDDDRHGRGYGRPMWGSRGGGWGGYEGSPRERAWWASHGYGPMHGGRGGGYMMGYRDAMRESRYDRDDDRRRGHHHDRDRDRGRRGRRDRGRSWGRGPMWGWGPRNDNYSSPWAFWRRMLWGR